MLGQTSAKVVSLFFINNRISQMSECTLSFELCFMFIKFLLNSI